MISCFLIIEKDYNISHQESKRNGVEASVLPMIKMKNKESSCTSHNSCFTHRIALLTIVWKSSVSSRRLLAASLRLLPLHIIGPIKPPVQLLLHSLWQWTLFAHTVFGSVHSLLEVL